MRPYVLSTGVGWHALQIKSIVKIHAMLHYVDYKRTAGSRLTRQTVWPIIEQPFEHMAFDSNVLAIRGLPLWIPTEPLAKWNDLSNLHLVRKSTIFHLNRRAKRNHFRSCDFNRLISQPEGSQGFTFPRQHWSDPLKKWSSGVCKGNFVLIVETNAVQPALCSPWVTVSIKAAGSILLSNTGRRWGEKHHELVSAEREREREDTWYY